MPWVAGVRLADVTPIPTITARCSRRPPEDRHERDIAGTARRAGALRDGQRREGNRAAATHAQYHAGHGSALVDPRAPGPGDAHPGGGHVERVLDDLARGCGARDGGPGGDARGRSRQSGARAREPRPRGTPRPRRHPRGPRRGHAGAASPGPSTSSSSMPIAAATRPISSWRCRSSCPAGSSSPTMSCRTPPSSRTTSDASSHIPSSSRSPCPSATGRRSPTSSRRRPPRRACRCSRRPRRGRRGGRGRARRPSGHCRSS